MNSLHPVIVNYGGRWERSNYVDGLSVLVQIPMDQVSRVHLIMNIRIALGVTRDIDYSIFFFTSHNDRRRIRAILQRDSDLFRLIFEQREKAEVYVIEIDSDQSGPQVGGPTSYVQPDAPNIPNEKDPEESSEDERDVLRNELIDSVTAEFHAWVREPGSLDQIMKHRKLTSHFATSHEEHAQRTMRSWIIPLPDFDGPCPVGWVEPSEPVYGELVVGSTFRTKADLNMLVGVYHMENQIECFTDRSTRGRLVFVCKKGRKNCTFRLCAVGDDETLWRITKLTLDHNCHNILDRTTARRVTAIVAASYFSRRLVGEGVLLRPRDMIEDMRSLFGIDIDYSFALRTRNIAIEMTYGKFELSYSRLGSYLYLLQERNAGTLYDIQTTSEGVFLHMFLALGQSIQAFEHYLRPVIILDGTHLKGKNKGILFVAVTNDGNEGIFPLAIGIGPIENDESWIYFLRNLRKCYPPRDDLLFVSDQHKSIHNAIQAIYPNVAHASCYHHIMKNLTRFGAHVISIFKNAAYSYRVETFEKHFADLQKVSPDGAYKRLYEIGVERWAKSKCQVRRYCFMTSNSAECFNSRLLWARRLPVCSLIEVFRSIMEKWFDVRRAKASNREHELTEPTVSKLGASVERGRHLVVRETTTHMYKVEEKKLSYLVDLQNWTCECREFDQDLIPCHHACAAIGRAGLSVYDFISPYFKTRNLLETYATPISSLPHPDEWSVPSNISSFIIQPPTVTRQAGRPRMSRARSAVEDASAARRVQVCAKCKGIGHNIRSCTNFVPVDTFEDNVPQQPRQKNRRKKKCSVCHSTDHTKPRCPMRMD